MFLISLLDKWGQSVQMMVAVVVNPAADWLASDSNDGNWSSAQLTQT